MCDVKKRELKLPINRKMTTGSNQPDLEAQTDRSPGHLVFEELGLDPAKNVRWDPFFTAFNTRFASKLVLDSVSIEPLFSVADTVRPSFVTSGLFKAHPEHGNELSDDQLRLLDAVIKENTLSRKMYL